MPRRTFARRPHLQRLEGRALLATLTVTNTNDSGAGSLRQAIVDADATPAASTIDFDIPGTGVQTIDLTTDLPQVTEPVTIDGLSQPGTSSSPSIRIDGSKIPKVLVSGNLFSPESIGLDFTHDAQGSLVRGLSLTSFGVAGIDDDAPNMTIQGNEIGVGPDPSADQGIGSGYNAVKAGIVIIGPSTGVAGTTISGNVIGQDINGIELDGASGVTISGNFIGTDTSQSANLGNGRWGIYATHGTTGVTIANNVLANNGGTAASRTPDPEFNGGAIGNFDDGGLTLVGNTLTNNQAPADIAVTVAPSTAQAAVGQPVSITYTFTNDGSSPYDLGYRAGPAVNLNPGSPAPSKIYQITGGTGPSGPDSEGDLIDQSLTELAPGATITATVEATILAAGTDIMTGLAQIGLGGDFPDRPATATATIVGTTAITPPAAAPADLAVTSSASPAAATVGVPETFTFMVTNRSAAAADVLFALSANAPVFYPGIGSAPGLAQAGVLVSQGSVAELTAGAFDTRFYGGDLGMLAAGASATVTVAIIPPVGGLVSASLYAYSANIADATPADNLAFAAAQAAPPVVAPPVAAPTLVAAQAIYASASGPIVGVQVDFQGALDPASARQLANYSLTTTGSSKAIKLKSATYSAVGYGGVSVVTIRTALPQPRAGAALQLVVDGPGSPGIRGRNSPARVPLSTRTVPR